MNRVLIGLLLAACCCAVLADEPPKADVAALARDERFAARGQVDLYVASTAGLDPKLKDEDERLWVPAVKLGAKILNAVDVTGDRKPRGGPLWFADFAAYRKAWHVDYIRTSETYHRPEKDERGRAFLHQAIQAKGVDAVQSINGLVVSRGPVRVKVCINDTFILATGNVEVVDGVSSSVIVCDGDVTVENVKRGLGGVVIARGNITIKGGSESSTLIAGGKVTVGRLPEQIQGEDPKDFVRRRLEIKEKETNPLGFITFFELHRIGLKVKVADKEVTVEAVEAKSACEKAGLKVGDVILEANGKKPADAEHLRRLLRDSLALGDAPLKVKRGNETLVLKVALPE